MSRPRSPLSLSPVVFAGVLAVAAACSSGDDDECEPACDNTWTFSGGPGLPPPGGGIFDPEDPDASAGGAGGSAPAAGGSPGAGVGGVSAGFSGTPSSGAGGTNPFGGTSSLAGASAFGGTSPFGGAGGALGGF